MDYIACVWDILTRCLSPEAFVALKGSWDVAGTWRYAVRELCSLVGDYECIFVL